MAEENELLRQQLEQVPMNLAERNATMAERDVTLAAERALRLSAEAGVQERTGGRSGQPMQQASAAQPVPEQGYRHQTPRRSSCRRKTACGCPSLMGAASCICGQANSKLS